MAKVNNVTTSRTASQKLGQGSKQQSEGKTSTQKKLPMPESYTNKQGSQNEPMNMDAPKRVKNRDFQSEEFTNENKNPNNEAFPKPKQPKGAGMGLGEIGRLANSSKWGQVGNS